MTSLGGGNFRQTYEGAVHTYNTYKNVCLSLPIRTIQGSCPWPAADTRLGTQNLCEGPKRHTAVTRHTSYTLHKVQCLQTACWCCALVPSPAAAAGGVCWSWCPPGEGGPVGEAKPRQSTHLSPIYQQLVGGLTPWQRLGNTFPEHPSPIPMTGVIPAQVSTF